MLRDQKAQELEKFIKTSLCSLTSTQSQNLHSDPPLLFTDGPPTSLSETSLIHSRVPPLSLGALGLSASTREPMYVNQGWLRRDYLAILK